VYDACVPDNGKTFDAALTEVICVMMFVSFILTIKFQDGAQDFLLNALGVGMTLSAMAYSSGYSGAGLNPAVTIPQTLFFSYSTEHLA